MDYLFSFIFSLLHKSQINKHTHTTLCILAITYLWTTHPFVHNPAVNTIPSHASSSSYSLDQHTRAATRLSTPWGMRACRGVLQSANIAWHCCVVVVGPRNTCHHHATHTIPPVLSLYTHARTYSYLTHDIWRYSNESSEWAQLKYSNLNIINVDMNRGWVHVWRSFYSPMT